MKLIKLSLVAMMVVSSVYAADTDAVKETEAQNVSEMFSKAKTSGEVRLGYVAQNNDDDTKNINGAGGGYLAIETASLNGISFGTAFYTTNRLQSNDVDSLGTSLFDGNDEGYTILGQAYANVSLDKTNLKVGRQQIDTPFANSDDIRMIPNLFEAYVLSNSNIEDLVLTAAHVSRWSGVDAPTPQKFEELVSGGDGANMFGAIYGGIQNSELSAWYYDINNLTKIAYLAASTELSLSDEVALNLGVQYADFAEYGVKGIATNIDGNVWGASAELGFASIGTTFNTAYNKSSNKAGKSVSNGFGGGPFFTSMEENTIDSLEGAEAYIAGVGFDFSVVGVDGLSLAYAKGNFKDSLTTSHAEIDESDYSLEYSFNENLAALLIYTDAKTTTDDIVNSDNTTFNRIQAYAKYSF